jgi:hypothetical protein
MLHVSYLGKDFNLNENWRFTRVIYYNPIENHWTSRAVKRYINHTIFDEVDIFREVCTRNATDLARSYYPDPNGNENGNKIEIISHENIIPMTHQNVRHLRTLNTKSEAMMSDGLTATRFSHNNSYQMYTDENLIEVSNDGDTDNGNIHEDRVIHRRRLAAWEGDGYVGSVKDKNWSPFSYLDKTYWVYKLEPLIVCELNVDLSDLHHHDCALCEHRYSTNSSIITKLNNKIMNDTLKMYPNGRWPSVYIHLNGLPFFKVDIGNIGPYSPQSFYLGVIHSVTTIRDTPSFIHYRQYVHFFVKLSTKPPFSVLEVSNPIRLRTGLSIACWFKLDERADVAFINGFDYNPSDVGKEFVLSYGEADKTSRIKYMSIESILQMF